MTKKDWDSAQRVAELYDPGSVDEVLVAQAHVVFSEGDLLILLHFITIICDIKFKVNIKGRSLCF